jgi:site-specific recombinase XerD
LILAVTSWLVILKIVTPHPFCHSMATRVLRNRADLRAMIRRAHPHGKKSQM